MDNIALVPLIIGTIGSGLLTLVYLFYGDERDEAAQYGFFGATIGFCISMVIVCLTGSI